jgi:hypothetical protein
MTIIASASHGAPNANPDYTAIADNLNLRVGSPRSHLKTGVAATEPGENKTLPNQEKTFLSALALLSAVPFEVRAEGSHRCAKHPTEYPEEPI